MPPYTGKHLHLKVLYLFVYERMSCSSSASAAQPVIVEVFFFFKKNPWIIM